MKERLDKIKPYLKDIINKFGKSDTKKIQLTVATDFFQFTDIDEEHVMHSKNDKIEIMIYDKAE